MARYSILPADLIEPKRLRARLKLKQQSLLKRKERRYTQAFAIEIHCGSLLPRRASGLHPTSLSKTRTVQIRERDCAGVWKWKGSY
jgi:hypothetical protein